MLSYPCRISLVHTLATFCLHWDLPILQDVQLNAGIKNNLTPSTPLHYHKLGTHGDIGILTEPYQNSGPWFSSQCNVQQTFWLVTESDRWQNLRQFGAIGWSDYWYYHLLIKKSPVGAVREAAIGFQHSSKQSSSLGVWGCHWLSTY
jgi:hypothetical protein